MNYASSCQEMINHDQPFELIDMAEETLVDFACEAELVLQEVSYAIAEGALSQKLQSTVTCAYINLTTKEKREVTVRLCCRGFEVISL